MLPQCSRGATALIAGAIHTAPGPPRLPSPSAASAAPVLGSYVVVWLPLISLVVRFTLWEAGLSAVLEVAPAGAKGNGTSGSALEGLPSGDTAAPAAAEAP